ncbi:MAG: class I SAM-dependent methyltransferase [Xanthomonadales bacterium]|nr:class I SAM-dependent methyltransferase [Xanthomonadales bacterium]
MTDARRADRHRLYQQAVQDPEAEMNFVEWTFEALRGRLIRSIREDFCGTAYSACEFVSRDPEHRAWAVDLDRDVLRWGRKHNVAGLSKDARRRIELVKADVRAPGTPAVDAVLAMNFSYYLFDDRSAMRGYFESVRGSLGPDGLFFLDAYGGYEAHCDIEEPRECDGFTYIWEQADFNPIDQSMTCYIHFEFPDGSRLDRAFVYPWRLWVLPEIRELLLEAGFSRVRVYWEGTDEETGEGDGEFTETMVGTADAGWICYIVAEP